MLSSSYMRKANYEMSDDTSDHVERLTLRFSTDLRKHIKKLNCPMVFTNAWLGMIEVLEHVSKIAGVENRPKQLLKENNSSSLLNIISNKKPQKTLWERDEYCVRYLVEEGKVNSLLRLLVEYKKKQYEISKGILNFQSLAKKLKLNDSVLLIKMKKFELYLGALLECCFVSKEALQTLDMHQLLNYVQQVLLFSKTSHFKPPKNGAEFSKIQEFKVLVYIQSIMERIDDLQEETIFSVFNQLDLFKLIVDHIFKTYPFMDEESLNISADLLADTLCTEYFRSKFKTYFKDKDFKIKFASLDEKFVKPLLVSYPRKKKLRPLTECIERLKITLE